MGKAFNESARYQNGYWSFMKASFLYNNQKQNKQNKLNMQHVCMKNK